MKDHEFREMVNALRDVALQYHNHESLRERIRHALRDALKSQAPSALYGWINPNDKTQRQYLPHIGQPVLFCHGGTTYYGKHTGGSFTTGQGATARHFITWDCLWMPLPSPTQPERNA